MIFGTWPGVVAADLVEFGPLECPPEDVATTLAALEELQGAAEAFYVRCYRHFGTGPVANAGAVAAPAEPARYAGDGRQVDLVACYQSAVPDAAGFAHFVRRAVRDVASCGGGKVQVGEELNVPAPQDGGSPDCFEAVAAGVRAALEERERLHSTVAIGVNSAGLADPAFWGQLAGSLGPDLLAQLDYLGLDAFPDVFRPIPHSDLPDAVRFLVETFRRVTTDVGISQDTPIHITETGWPTGDDRDEATQARVLRTVAETIRDSGVGVSAYELFGLRDGLTTGTWTSRFGLLRDDYSPKPSFTTMRDLIDQRSHRG